MDLEREKRFHGLLEQALVLSGAERKAFLVRECADDSALRADLERSLEEEETLSDGAFDHPTRWVRAAMQESVEDPLSLAAGVLSGPIPLCVGPYLLHEILGEGGMGRVFRAEKLYPDPQIVALKLMRNSVRGPVARERFEAERQALDRLDHPNIGRILDAGIGDDGFPFFAMELLHGESITRHCDHQGLGIPERLRLFVQVCEGVHHAHGQQILHRDLKPSNVLVVEDAQGNLTPKIIDFGIAVFLGGNEEESAEGGEKSRVGTPVYMSPEALAQRGDTGPTTDVYTLGVMLYELLIGTRPFEMDDSSVSTYTRRIAKTDPQPPSKRFAQLPESSQKRRAERRGLDPEGLKALLEGELDAVVSKAIAKSPEERYPSARALGEALGAWLEGR